MLPILILSYKIFVEDKEIITNCFYEAVDEGMI